MQSLSFICHDSVVAVSFVACIVGLLLLWERKQNNDEAEETEKVLFRMSFSYWLLLRSRKSFYLIGKLY
jgi:uncharacterized membrane protein